MDTKEFEELKHRIRENKDTELLIGGMDLEGMTLDEFIEVCDLLSRNTSIEKLCFNRFRMGSLSWFDNDPNTTDTKILAMINDFVTMLKTKPNLKTLILSENELEDEELVLIYNALAESHIESLTVALNDTGRESIGALASLLRTNDKLKRLYIHIDPNAGNLDVLFTALKDNKTLEECWIYEPSYIFAGPLEALAENISNTALKKLNFPVLLHSAHDLQNVAKLITNGANLDELTVHFHNVGDVPLTQEEIDDGVDFLLKALAQTSPEYLTLNITGLGDRWTTEALWDAAANLRAKPSKFTPNG